MKITHFINLPSLGGIERLFLAFINAKVKDVEHDILLSGDMNESATRELNNFKGKINNYKRWGALRIPGWPKALRKLHLDQILRHVAVPDVLLMWSQLNSREVAKVYKKHGAKIIYYEHGSAWLCDPSAERIAFLREVDEIICASNACARMLNLRYLVPKEKMTICTNPLLPGLLPHEIPDRKPIANKTLLKLGVAGRLVPLKAHGIAIATVKALSVRGINCELHVAGSGPLENELKTLSKELGIANKIKFHSFVNDMGSFFKSIDIFLCPSLREPFGLVSVEASAWGCPVIAANVDGLPETLIDRVTGYLVSPTEDPNSMKEVLGKGWPNYVYNPVIDKVVSTQAINPEKLADIVSEMIADPIQLNDMGKHAAKYAKEKFRYEIYLKNLTEILVQKKLI